MILFAKFALPRLLESGFEVVGAVADGNAFVHAFGQLHPDVCVIDISTLLKRHRGCDQTKRV
jgi:AmiR/NasT family two-component response regulator